ncbi:hypothetical protein KSF_046650 [Reticulibacter mediterranei]|uniref:Uncharacterized protein n=1 Tax=Reticulibacter mediterranei TaxID=2778369 RepID=A0A8J3IPE3_9CHLR|nr:hypothetical protein [Reticulibacter mediterranei]GHO94617.1 hypothetical protein KSF_046650 [Reticulibacter mediterranei]
MSISKSNADKCKRLRKLHTQLVEELRVLKEELREEEGEGFENPIETVNIIKSLQQARGTIEQELQKCPPED